MQTDLKNIPKHIAIIMDGNGRWAQKKGLPRTLGHNEGSKVVNKIVMKAKDIGVKYITLYAFSTENWKRSKIEVNAIMQLIKQYLKKESKNMQKNNIRLTFSGRRENVSKDLLKVMDDSVEKLKDNDGINLIIAFNYGGRSEIIDGINKLIKEDKKEISEEEFKNYLYNPEVPDPELVIRTSGEFRISNFLLWQVAYAEFYISQKFWPDFKEEDLEAAIHSYQNRNRRFGGV